MASEAAKQKAREQKELLRAEKERRKNSDDPRDWGQVRQIRETYKRTVEYDKALPWLLAGTFVAVLAILLVIGFLLQPWWLYLVLGLMLATSATMGVFLWRVKKSMYKRFEGQVGSVEVALSMLPKKKWTSTPAIAGTREMDVIHRTFGPGGLVLVTEGDPRRLKTLLATETRRHEQASGGVKVTHLHMGTKEGQIPLDKLADHIKKLPKSVDDAKLVELQSRMKALDTMRSKLPIPKGPIPTRMSRSALRGR